MSKPFFQSGEIFSLAIMLLMFVALVAGQADATLRATANTTQVEPAAVFEDHLIIDVDSQFGTTVLKIAVDVAADLNYLRNEKEGKR